MTWIQTISGRAIDLRHPDPSQICLRDIAHSLSGTARFVGHTVDDVTYSVAQHSVLVYRAVQRVDSSLALVALLHDAHEYVTGDVPAPLKKLMGPELFVIERAVQDAIWTAFNIEPPTPEEWRVVHEQDIRALATERRDLCSEPPRPWEALDGVDPWPRTITPMGRVAARHMFMNAAAEYALS